MKKLFAVKTSIIPIILGILLLFSGCSTNLPSVCDDTSQPSKLCDLSEQAGVRLEDVGNGLIIANAVAIAEGIYTKEEALEVLVALRAFLDAPVSYLFFNTKINEYLNEYPGIIQIAESYFDAIGGLSQIMYAKDQEILKDFLDEQIERLSK